MSRGVLVLALALSFAPRAAAGILDGVAAAGDSMTDEYQFTSYSYAHNWLEQLAVGRGLDFGGFRTSSWGEPRRNGYERNWARGGATTASLLSQGQHTGLANQVANGDVTLAYLGIGANDFGGAYGAIYNGSLAGDDLAGFVDDLVGRIGEALSSIESAGPVEMVLATIPDYGNAPAFRAGFPSASLRQRVTDATAAANVQIRELAASRSVPVVDLEAAGEAIFAASVIEIGGVSIGYGAGSAATNMFVADGVHPHSVMQGLIANLFIEAAHRAYGAELAPFSDQELLANAGITPPGGDPTYFPVSSFVVFDPVAGDATLDGAVTGADYTVWADHYGQHDGDAQFRDGDFNGDGFVSGADYTIWADAYGVGPTAVPEPASGVAVAMAALGSGVIFRKRRKNA